MIIRTLLAAAVLGLWSAPAAAQSTGNPPAIVVVGHGTASMAPDSATFTYSVRGEGKTEVLALQALSDARGRVEGELVKLAGASRVDIEPSDLAVSTARAGECRAEDSGDAPTGLSTGPCAITGYVVTMKVKVEIEPADKVGDAISLAAELGASDATFGEWDVRDVASLRDAAVRDAVEKARREAERIATSAGLKLGPILRIEGPNVSRDAVGIMSFGDLSNLSPGLSYSKPHVQIGMKPQPVEADATYVVTFSIAP